MFKKIFFRGAVTLALTAWLALGQGAPAMAGTFKDTDNHWSRVVVDKSYALELMKGYPGDIFKPEDSVTRLEAIAVIINAMGLEKEAKNVDYKNSGIRLPPGMFWGQGHLVIAVQKGLLHKDYVNQLLFGSPIPRQEVATLVAVALRDKIKTKGDPSKLSYTDTGEIGLTYLPYVADVTQNNIMQGLGGNEFGPNQIMKRGQMAALMVKTTQEGWFEYGSGKIISGSLSASDSVAGVVSITKTDGVQMPKLVDTGAVFYKDSKPSSLAQFKVGEAVTAITGPGGKIRYLEGAAPSAKTDPITETELTGKISNRALTGNSSLKIRDSGFQEKTYPLDPVITITDGVNARDMSNVTDGTYVRVKIKNNSIQNIRILSSEEVTGAVTTIIPGYLTIKTDSGSSRIFSVNSGEMKIVKGGSRLAYSELKSGDRVKVISASGEALEVAVTQDYTPSSSSVQIRAVDAFYGFIYVMNNNGGRREYEVEINALITKRGEIIRIEDLKSGDSAILKVGENGKVYEIQVEETDLAEVSGKVTDLWPEGDPQIYIEGTKYSIASYVKVTKSGNNATLRDIMIGSRVTLKHNNYIASVIEITNDQYATLEGKVTDVSESSGTITIKQVNGLSFTLPVDRNCSYRDLTTSQSLYLGGIRSGWAVRISLYNGKAEEIKVTSK